MSKEVRKIGRLQKLRRVKSLAYKFAGIFLGRELPRFKGKNQRAIYEEIVKDRMDMYPNCRFMQSYNPFGTNYELYLIPRLNVMSLKDLRDIANTYIHGLEQCENKTYYHRHIAYRLLAVQKGKEGWNDELKKNWLKVCKQSASEVDDCVGRSYGTGKTRQYKSKLEKRQNKIMANKKKEEKIMKKSKKTVEEAPVKKTKKTVVEEKPVKKSKKVKQYDEPKRGRPAAGEKTLSGTIIKYLAKGRGMTREELMENLIEEFPTRDPEIMSRSLSVYLSSFFKKKFTITTDSKGRIKFTEKDEDELKADKKAAAKKAAKAEDKPKKAKKASKDDDEDEDEDEEEEAPKKKKVKKVAKEEKKAKKGKKAKKSRDEDEDDED